MIELVADVSITDCVNSVREISVACGQGVINEDVSTDLDAMKTMNSYLALICKAFGDNGIDSDSITDSFSAMTVMTQNIANIVRHVV